MFMTLSRRKIEPISPISHTLNNKQQQMGVQWSEIVNKTKGCLAYGEPSSDIVPFNFHTSTLLADKLVEVPRDTLTSGRENSTRTNKSFRSETTIMKHEQVLQQHRPIGLEPPQVVEWSEMRDPESQKIYYHNKITGKSVWTKPAGFDEAVAIAAKEEATRGTFWIEVQDSKGRSYYYDLLTRETRWDRPANFEMDLEKA
jgi:hypothetical protein